MRKLIAHEPFAEIISATGQPISSELIMGVVAMKKSELFNLIF